MMLGGPRRAIEHRLAQLDIPALVVMGTKDRDFKDPAAEADLVARRVRGEVAMVEGAGHYPHVEFPGRTSRLVLDFAKRTIAPLA
jgi:pimeloyl-ACP methyl ester carboxylesterase